MSKSIVPMRRRVVALLFACGTPAGLLTACGGGGDGGGGGFFPVGVPGPGPTPAPTPASTMVYAMTNAAVGNQVVAYRRGSDGMLTQLGSIATGGNGLGSTEISAATPQEGIDVLASQGALRFTPDKRFLLAVNAGSHTVTSFRVQGDGQLNRVDVKSSGGLQPNAIGARNDLVYVANVGAASNGFNSNVVGFTLDSAGMLTMIGGSTRSLSTATAQPANLVFAPGGSLLAVSELTTNRISVFPVATDGTLGAPTVNASSGAGPFGAVFLEGGQLIVTEAQAPGVPGSVSSYSVGSNGALTSISLSVPNGQGATCWTMLTPDQRRLYTSNTATGNLSFYRVDAAGTLTLAQQVASALEGAMSGPVDGGVSEDGNFLYVLNSGMGSITAHRIGTDGTLTKIQTVGGLPPLGAQGLVVR